MVTVLLADCTESFPMLHFLAKIGVEMKSRVLNDDSRLVDGGGVRL